MSDTETLTPQATLVDHYRNPISVKIQKREQNEDTSEDTSEDNSEVSIDNTD